jgi:L-aspartate oxidase
VVADTEFVQFHPTAIAVGRDPAPLASEAFRGVGAILVIGDGQRFMAALHAQAELAPRDVVARAVFAEVAAGRGAFLDTREAIGAAFADRFPTVHASCIAAGIDPTRDLIPVAPAAHYHMGGVASDLRGRTSLPGLWAAGEVAATGAHGANRLASNSLLEALVFAGRIADDLSATETTAGPSPIAPMPPTAGRRGQPNHPPSLERGLRELMARHVGVIRDREGLATALDRLTQIETETDSPTLHNMATAALLITAAAWRRRESRGAHERADFPDSDPAQARRNTMTLAQARKIAHEKADIAPAEAV